MENNFYRLPPLKRIRFMKEEQDRKRENDAAAASLLLPAKKRKELRGFPQQTPKPAAVAATFCLPAKKRIWAPPPHLLPEEPTSPFDLNVEYKPISDREESDPSKTEEAVPEKINQIEEDEGHGDDGVHGGASQSTDGDLSDPISEEQEEAIDEHSSQTAEEENDDDVDDGIYCSVCQSTDGDPSDPIVFCDGCDLMVHKTCYGSPLTEAIPEGDWFCTQCSESQSHKSPFSCCLCPVAGGAMKPTTDGRWAHLVCALFVPEVFFTDPEGREGIDCSRVPQKRWEQRCYLCGTKSGCAIECSELKCRLSFHAGCGLKEDLCIEYREGRNNGAIVAGFCKDHSELWRKQEQTGKYKIVARE